MKVWSEEGRGLRKWFQCESSGFRCTLYVDAGAQNNESTSSPSDFSSYFCCQCLVGLVVEVAWWAYIMATVGDYDDIISDTVTVDHMQSRSILMSVQMHSSVSAESSQTDGISPLLTHLWFIFYGTNISHVTLSPHPAAAVMKTCIKDFSRLYHIQIHVTKVEGVKLPRWWEYDINRFSLFVQCAC